MLAHGDEHGVGLFCLDCRACAACHEVERLAAASLQQLTAARDAARTELAAARAAAPRPPVDIAPAGAVRPTRSRPDAESAARDPKRPRTSGA
jgi:cytochrome c peroxidase